MMVMEGRGWDAYLITLLSDTLPHPRAKSLKEVRDTKEV
jgi:hypothetical protein